MEANLLNNDHAVVQPSTSTDIEYRAFSRPYAGGPSQVLNLFASCSYPTGQWQIFFSGNGDGSYTLMEKVPNITNQMITYYSASFTTGVGLAHPVDTVVIQDARGIHHVAVQSLT